MVGLALTEFLNAPVEVADMGSCLDDDLPVQLEDQPQNPMGCRVLGPHIDGHESRFCHFRPLEQRVCQSPVPRPGNLSARDNLHNHPRGESSSGPDDSQREFRRGHRPPFQASWPLSRSIRRSKWILLQPPCFESQPLVVLHGVEKIDDLKARSFRKEIDTAEVGEKLELKLRIGVEKLDRSRRCLSLTP